MTTTITAPQRRLNAIEALMTEIRYVVKSQYAGVQKVRVVWVADHSDRAAVAANIRGLAPLGRTDRWQNAVEAWAVEVETSTPETFQWAVDQFGIWACYAAE